MEGQKALSRLYPSVSVQLFSSATSVGLEEAREAVAKLLGIGKAAEGDVPDARPAEVESTRKPRSGPRKRNPRLKGIKPGVKPQL
jgi:hypothetical protein